MSFFEGNNPSREIGLYLYAAYLARQQDDDGIVRCAYCAAELVPTDRALDHTDPSVLDYQSGETVVAACGECNRAAGRHTPRDHERLADHLRDLGVDPREAVRRVKRILRLPLPSRRSADVVRIAEEHFGDRLQEQRRLAALRSGRDPATAGTGRTRARQLEADAETDVPF